MFSRIVQISTGVVLAILCSAGMAADFSGHWEGAATRGGASSPIMLDIETSGDEVQVRYSYPRSGTLRNPVDEATVDGDVLTARYGSGDDERVFKVRQTGEDELHGGLTIAGEDFPLTLKRSVDDRPYTVEDVTFHNGDVRLNGRLVIPEGEGPFPGFVHVHGSGDGTIDDFSFWADYFARMGIASLVYDKRGCGESTGAWRDVGFLPLADDAIAAVNVLLQRPDIDRDRIGLTGISQAGWIMPLAASRSAEIDFLVVISGPTITVEEEGYYDFLEALRDKGYGEDVLREAREILEMNSAVVRSGALQDELRERVLEVRKEPWFRDMGFVRMPEGGWYAKIIDHDPLPILKALDIPMLWVYGMDDNSVPPERCAVILEELQAEMGKDYTIIRVPAADHGVRVERNPAEDALPFGVYPSAYLDGLSSWLKSRILDEE